MSAPRPVPIAALIVAAAFAALSSLPWLRAQGVPAPAPGGFLESATSTAVRPRLTTPQLQAFLPLRGEFTFPAPYFTTGIRLTHAGDCGGTDCVRYVGYSYWRNMNNSAGSNDLYVVLGLDAARGGTGPTLFRYDKLTGVTVNLGAIFTPGDPLSGDTTEGWYFSATGPTTLYVPVGRQLRRVDVLTRAVSVAFDITAALGADKIIAQAHSSHDDRVHSFTLALASTRESTGCAVYREDTEEFAFFPATGDFDECQIDKSGHWLLIKEDVDGIHGEDNRIINLATRTETVLLDAAGAAGHSDNGFGTMVAADNFNPLPNALRLWTFGPGALAPGLVVHQDPQWIPQSFAHVSFANARSAPLDQQYACGSAANSVNGPRANEISCVRLDGSKTTLVVAPVMTDMNASGGGDSYGKMPKGNLDPTGQYFVWTSNLNGNRLDAFIARVPSQLLVTPPSDTTAPAAAVTSPVEGATVTGDVLLSATASDNVGVAGVQFTLDGVNLGTEITAPPFAWTWHTASAPDGVHALTAVARDAANNVTVSAPVTVTVLNSGGAPAISNVAAARVTGTTAIIIWKTNQLADSQIDYGLTTAYGNATGLDAALVSAHLQTISGLTPNSTYHYRVTSRNAQGVAATSADLTFTTSSAPIITGISVSSITQSSATVSWTTNVVSSTTLEYGTTATYGLQASGPGGNVTLHTVNLAGLAHGTTYHVRVSSMTPGGAQAVSNDFTFSTLPGVVVSNVTISNVTGASAAVTWTTNEPTDTQIEYGPTTAYGSLTSLNPALVLSHGQAVNSGVQPGTTYHLRIRARNAAGVLGVSANLSFTTAPAPVISDVAVASVTGTSATITWTTDLASNSRIEYGLTGSYGQVTVLDPAMVTSHSHTITGLTPGTTYVYLVRSTTALNALKKVGGFTVTTASPPVLSGIAALDLAATSARIAWITNQPADSQIDYGPTTAYGTTLVDPALVTSHSRTITDLTIGTVYHYRVRSTNAAGIAATSADFTFNTNATPVPVISNVVISNIQGASAAVNWTTDQPTDTQIEYGLTTAYGWQTPLNPALLTGHGQAVNASLVPGTTYHLRIRARNAAGLLATSGNFSFTTAPAPVISAVAVASVTGTSATIAWTTDLASNSRIEFGLTGAYGSVTVLDPSLVTAHSHTITGLAPGTTYFYLIRSVTAQNALTKLGGFTVTTAVPPVLTNVTASGVTATSATVTWTTSHAADSEVEFGPTPAYGGTVTDAALATAHAVVLTGLTPGTTYHYRARSTNSAGLAATSSGFTLTTLAAPVISAVAASAITGNSAAITWTTDLPSTSVVDYGETAAYGSTTALDPTFVTAHGRTITGLAADTTYFYRVRSTSATNVSVELGGFTFRTLAPPQGAQILNVTISNIQGASAAVNWQTDQPADTQIEYGLTTAYGSLTPLNPTLMIGHGQAINSGLVSGTTYHFRIRARNAAGHLATSVNFSFTTAPAPVISAVAVASATGTSATITWTTDLPSNSRIEYGLTGSYGSATVLDPALVTAHSHTIAGLTPGATYFYLVRSVTAQNALTKVGGFTVTMPTPPAISGVGAHNITATSARIAWMTNQAADSIVEYGVTTAYGSTLSDPAAVTSHSLTIAGLSGATLYHYRVTSTNWAGQTSTSADATFSTDGGLAPVVSNVIISNIQGASAAVTWLTDQPADTQIDYGLTTAYGAMTSLNPALVLSHGQAINAALVPGTTYHFRIRARNAAGVLGVSGNFTFTTAPAPVISAVAVAAVTSTSATITWTTHLASNSRIEYGLTGSYGSVTVLDPALVTSHSHTITGLAPGTTYFFLVRSITGQNALTKVGGFTFTTAPPGS